MGSDAYALLLLKLSYWGTAKTHELADWYGWKFGLEIIECFKLSVVYFKFTCSPSIAKGK